MILQPGVNAGGIDGGDQRGEDPLARQILGRDFTVGIRRGHQQERHKGQQAGHHRVEIKLTAQTGTNPYRDEERHHAHAEVKRQHQLFAVRLREIEPAAGKAVSGICGERREDKYQHKRADDHKRQRGGKAVTDGNHVLLLAQLACQRRDGLLNDGNHRLI